MSKLSIYENHWIDMVFEGKNKEYGAYQLRKDGNKTMFQAFFISLILVTSVVFTTILLKNLNPQQAPTLTNPEILEGIIKVSYLPPNKPLKQKAVLPISKKTTTTADKQSQLIDPEIVKPADAVNDIAPNTKNTSDHEQNSLEGTTESATIGGSTIPSNTVGTTEVAIPNINTTSALDKLPEFPGGISKFYTYVGNNFEKPEIDIAKTMKIYVSFVIEKDGSMTDIKVTRDPGYGLGQEAIRVLKSLKTKWSPGLINGKAVRTAYNLPIVVEVR